MAKRRRQRDLPFTVSLTSWSQEPELGQDKVRSPEVPLRLSQMVATQALVSPGASFLGTLAGNWIGNGASRTGTKILN